MKKITLIWLFIFALVLSGCMNKKVGNIESTNYNCDKNQCIENYNCNCDQNECIWNNSCNGEHYKCIGNNSCNSDQNECIGEIYFSTYEWELVVEWVWPEISMEPTLEEWILALRWNFEDHTDHVFLRPWIWENYFQSEDEYLPGNTVKLIWKVQSLDWAAGNHYYVVEEVEKLEFVDYPTEGEIKELLESYKYCEKNSDCTYYWWSCPFGCYVEVNNSFTDISKKIIDNYISHQGIQCVYDCANLNTVKCENYKCEMVASNENWATE